MRFVYKTIAWLIEFELHLGMFLYCLYFNLVLFGNLFWNLLCSKLYLKFYLTITSCTCSCTSTANAYHIATVIVIIMQLAMYLYTVNNCYILLQHNILNVILEYIKLLSQQHKINVWEGLFLSTIFIFYIKPRYTKCILLTFATIMLAFCSLPFPFYHSKTYLGKLVHQLK